MRILRFEHNGAPHMGAELDSVQVVVLTHPACGLPAATHEHDYFDLDSKLCQSVASLLTALASDTQQLEALRAAGAVLQREDVQLLAPIARPGKFMCIGLNYRDHAEESGMAVPEQPVMFCKLSNAVTGPNAPVILPITSKRVDYEAEFAIVIGRRCHRVSQADAMDAVFGYTCVNDVSARDLQEMDGQWVRAKSLDTFGPIGEAVVGKEHIADPHKLGIRLRLNGETLQDSSTNQLIFGVAELVSFLSQDMTLEPGDVISTGTPPGVGFARKPPIYLKDGDVMEVEIDGIGVLRNPVRA